MGPLTCHHPREAEVEVGGAAILTLTTFTAMKTITISTVMITTTTGGVMMTHTMATRTSRGLGEDGEPEESAEVLIRPEAAVLSHRGGGWAFPRGELSEQSEVKNFFIFYNQVTSFSAL